MLERLSPTKRNLALAALGLLLIWFSWTVRAVLNPLILGYLLAFVLAPMVRWLQARGWGRRAAANLIFLGFFVAASLLSVVVFWQGRALAQDLRHSNFAQEVWPQVKTLLDGFVDTGGAQEGAAVAQEARPAGDPASTEDSALRTLLEGIARADTRAKALEAWPYLQRFFGSVVAIITLLMLLPIYAYFLLFELDRIHAFVYRYIPRAEKERFARIGRQVGEVLASFFRGRLLICLLKGGVITAGLFAVQVPYAVFLGMGSGFLSLVPFVGPMLGFVAAYLLAAFPPVVVEPAAAVEGAAWLPMFWALVRTGSVFGVAELLEGYVLLPKILGDSLGLHPVVVLASIFIGGAALGMFGFLIALPLTAVLVILGREMVLPALADFADEEARAVKGKPKKKG